MNDCSGERFATIDKQKKVRNMWDLKHLDEGRVIACACSTVCLVLFCVQVKTAKLVCCKLKNIGMVP